MARMVWNPEGYFEQVDVKENVVKGHCRQHTGYKKRSLTIMFSTFKSTYKNMSEDERKRVEDYAGITDMKQLYHFYAKQPKLLLEVMAGNVCR